jgi:hemolysin activation/secretion protein
VANHRNIVIGDTLQWTALVTDEQTWLSTLNYEFPIGGSGLRLQFNGLLSQYQLGAGDFAGLASGGTQQIGTRVSYPFIRSQQANLNLNLGSQWTAYQNELLADTDRYQIATLPLGASFDVRDNLGLGGVTYGAVSLQLSRIVQDNRTRSAAQEYSVLSLDLGRVQQFSPPWQLQVRLSSQYSGSLIDSSDFIALGGFNAVRAYPVGEFSGQKGTVFQGELSYGLPQANATTYAFVDAGVATRSTPNGDSEQRALSGIGLVLRAGFNTLNIDVSASVPVTGGRSVAEPGHRGPWVWLAITNRF